jgi:hypothetical protein
MDRMAFATGGDEYRVAVRDVVVPHFLPALNGYLSGRHTPSKQVSSSELASNVSDDFFDMLNQSELSFARLSDLQSMIDEVVERLKQPWEIMDLEALGEIAKREAGIRGHNLKPLLSEVIQQLENTP